MKYRQTRTRKIHLPSATRMPQIKSIVARLNSIESVTSVTIDATNLTINYTFPDFVIGSAWRIVDHYINSRAFNYTDKLRYRLIAWKEDNERDHLYSRSCWDRYIQDIYIGHSRHQYSTSTQFKKTSPTDMAYTKPVYPTDN